MSTAHKIIWLLIYLVVSLRPINAQEYGGPTTTPLLMVGNKVLSPTSIRFHIQDISDNETGYVIHDASERTLTSSGPDPFPAWLEADNLSPNTYYCHIHAHVVKSGVLSPPGEEFPCVYTFAITPEVPKVLKTESGSVTLALGDPGNPQYTKYRIEEVRRGLWVTPVGTLSAQPTSKTLTEWGGSGGVRLHDLEAGAYEFRAYAKNGNDFLTDPSPAVLVLIESAPIEPTPPISPEPAPAPKATPTPTPSIEEMEFQPPWVFGQPTLQPLISPRIDLEKEVLTPTSTPEIVTTSTPEITTTSPIIANTSTADAPEPNKVLTIISKNLSEFRKLTIDNPQVEFINSEVVVPTLQVTAVTTAASVPTLPSLLTYLRLIFTQPFLFLARRKRKTWGTIYNSITKLPVDLAIVRLIDWQSGKIITSRVTDRAGRFAFLVRAGKYRLEVTKPQTIFPTKILKDKKADGLYSDLYHAKEIEVGKEGLLISPNIPLDPAIRVKSSSKLIFETLGRKLQYALSASSVIFSGFSFIISPLLLTGGLFIIHALLWILTMRLARSRRMQGWGRVSNTKNGRALPLAIVRIFDIEYNKLLETAVTDFRGRYNFLVGQNIYYLTAEKRGFQVAQTEKIDFTSKKGAGIITQNIALTPAFSPFRGGR